MDFDAAAGDRVKFDYGTYSDIMVFGRLSDGQSWTNFNGTAQFLVTAADVNGDALTDTVLPANNDSITLLGVAPDQLRGNCLFGRRNGRRVIAGVPLRGIGGQLHPRIRCLFLGVRRASARAPFPSHAPGMTLSPLAKCSGAP